MYEKIHKGTHDFKYNEHNGFIFCIAKIRGRPYISIMRPGDVYILPGHDWFIYWLAASVEPTHAVNQFWLMVNCTLKINFRET